MPYGHKAGDNRVYEYGVPRTAVHHGLLKGEELAVEEMRGQVRLWNHLVVIETGHRAERQIILSPYPLVDDGKRKRRVLPIEAIDALQALDRMTTDHVNVACRESGLYSWHYTDVKLRWLAARARFDPPKRHRFDGNEKVSTWLPGGMPVPEVWAGNTLLRFERGNREGDVLVHLRIASDDHRPVWMVLPIRMHRPLPEHGLIRCVSAVREMVGPTVRWKVIVTVESRQGWQTFGGPRSGEIGIDVGWRIRPDGLRVAVWQDTHGDIGELCLWQDHIAAMAHVDDLKSQRALAFNAAVASLRDWAKAHAPEWLREELARSHQWKRYGRLVWLLRMWQERRFDGDGEALEAVVRWQRRDRLLWEEEANLRDKRLRDRRERYRLFAAWVANSYERVMIEDFDLSEVAEVKDDGKGGDLPPAVRHNRQLAGVYQLRLALLSACRREGVEVVLRKAAGTTMICAECGSVERFDQGKYLEHTCGACGVRHDQDENAAANILVGRSL